MVGSNGYSVFALLSGIAECSRSVDAASVCWSPLDVDGLERGVESRFVDDMLKPGVEIGGETAGANSAAFCSNSFTGVIGSMDNVGAGTNG